MKDFFLFRRMLMPKLIQVSLVVGSLIFLYTGLYDIFALKSYWMGAVIIIAGPIAMRLLAELLIVVYRVNETLTDIHNLLQRDEISKTS